jgi:hypothetical protein
MDFVNAKPDTRTLDRVMSRIANITFSDFVEASSFGLRSYQVSYDTVAAANLSVSSETANTETGIKVLFAVHIKHDDLCSEMFGPFSVGETALTRAALTGFLSSQYAKIPDEVNVSSVDRNLTMTETIENLVGALHDELMCDKGLSRWTQQLVTTYAIPEIEFYTDELDTDHFLHFVIANVVVNCLPDELDGVILM